MLNESSDKTSKRFSDSTYAIPFGRYVGSSEVEPPADEVLVGRKGQRAFLIESLISTGRRGAFLVTGRRGTGKSSFVKHCIEEYRVSVFRRFLRGNVGRSFWDRAFVLLFWAALLVTALFVSELTQVLAPLSEGVGPHKLLALLLVPVGIALLYPCVYAQLVFETVLRRVNPVLRSKDQTKEETNPWPIESHFPGITATILTGVVAIIFWYSPPFGAPALGVIAFAPIVGGIYLAVHAASFQSPNPKDLNQKWWQRLRLNKERYFPLVLLTPFFGLLAWVSIFPQELLEVSPADAFQIESGLGITFLGLGGLLRAHHQRRLAKKHETPEKQAQRQALRRGGNWYSGVGIILTILGTTICLWAITWPSPAAWALMALLLFTFGVLLVAHLRDKDDNQFRPRPALALAAKALLSIAVSLQLVHPLLIRLPRLLDPWASDCLAARSPLFATRYIEIHWLFAVLGLLVAFYFMEYEWVVRPYTRTRAETNLDSSPSSRWDDREDESIPEQERGRVYRQLAALTLPWAIYETWLPVLPIQVNLGFDRLGHRAVIQAMLVGLRNRYHRFFLAWNSGFANLGRFMGACALLVLVNLASEAWFALDDPKLTEEGACAASVADPNSLPRFVTLLCHVSETWFRILYFDFVPKPLEIVERAAVAPPPFLGLIPHSQYGSIHFRLYHLLLLASFFLVGRWLLRKVPLLPYQENLRRIDDLLNSLSQHTRETTSRNFWGPARWVYNFFSDEKVQETQRDPVDPRTVELAFLQILEDIQKGGFRMPGAARNHLTMPAPEITFVFDELDKLGTRVDPESTAHSSDEQEEGEVLHRERQRAVNLRSLLSDLKNILASAPARFIFVGGRDLHDEWLADQTSRLPLLTSIFNTEVYLSSLLTDDCPQLHSRVEEYLIYQHRKAELLYYRSLRKRWRPSLALPLEALSHDRFVPAKKPENLSITRVSVIDCETGKSLDSGQVAALRQDFILFLTLRSMGNPKKLKELLESFVRPAGRELKEHTLWDVPCRHLLRLGDTEIFRIQLLVDIYRHLALAFEERMVQRDDKLAVSIFFLTDFLFKFHRRAFSWSNLERVDDLAHIHRLPDLRDIQEEIVDHFSERFLHRVLNGMYAFRFRSDIAREVEYLSRKSAAEMAAFNFTLDESQSLKADYLSALRGKEGENPDLVAALGELYEFDQDFERARHQYRVAIDLLDKELTSSTGGQKDENDIGMILIGRARAGQARSMMAWGLTRLRLMLQIGMTFEYARDLERAEAEYRSARTLARALVKAYVDSPRDKASDEPPIGGSRLHSLKQMNILFQPMFAEAWVAEKFSGTIDTSITLVERQLWEVRRTLPFVRESQIEESPAMSTAVLSHANFALTLSQLHNKAGDLCFFKGRQPVTPDRIRKLLCEPKDRTTDGYLLRAHYHYALGLHDIRHYIFHRVARSKDWLSIASPKLRSKTLQADALPDFIFRATAGSVNDMAEATLARVSLFDIFHILTHPSGQRKEPAIKDLNVECLQWLGQDDKYTVKSTLANWFGKWLKRSVRASEEQEPLTNLIEFAGANTADERLLMSLRLCRVGADLFAEGGYPEDAGRELLQASEMVTHYLWWGRIVEWIGRVKRGHTSLPDYVVTEIESWKTSEDFGKALTLSGVFTSEGAKEFWPKLIDLAVEALQKADSLFHQSRYRTLVGSTELNGPNTYLIGEIVPPEAVTVLCSLAMAADNLLGDHRTTLDELLMRWTGSSTEDANTSKLPQQELFADILQSLLERHRYPMINRLSGMRVLIGNLALGKFEPQNENARFELALTWTEELLELNTLFDSPLHFTPLQSGITCALIWLWGKNLNQDRNSGDRLTRILHAAQRDLQNSEEMYTMRRAYYESINSLYYLYDDFNDRQIHFNHAIQMAGAELVAILKALINQAPVKRSIKGA